MTEQFNVAVDMGATKTAALAVTTDERGAMRIVGFCQGPSAGILRGVVEDESATADSINSALSHLERLTGEKIDRIALGVSGSLIASTIGRGLIPIFPQGRPLTREDVLQVVRHSRQAPDEPNREQFFAAPARFIVNGKDETTKPIGIPAHKLEVQTTLVTGDADQIRTLESVVSRMDRDLVQLTPTAFGSASGVLGASAATTMCAVVDIGAEKTEVAIYDRGAPYSLHTILIGSKHFSSDVAKLLRTSNEEGERLKCTYGSQPENKLTEGETVDVLQAGQIHPRPLDRKVLSQILGSRVKELARFVREHVASVGVIGRLTGGVVLTGGGAKLAGIEDIFESVFPDAAVHIAWPKVHSVELSDPAMSAVVGLAKIALQSEDDDLAPAAGIANWKERIRTFKLKLTSRA